MEQTLVEGENYDGYVAGSSISLLQYHSKLIEGLLDYVSVLMISISQVIYICGRVDSEARAN